MNYKFFSALIMTAIFWAGQARAEKIVVEAEHYKTIMPSMQLTSDQGASGGKAIQVPLKQPRPKANAKPSDDGNAEYRIVAPHAGDYQFWARSWFFDAQGNSFYVLADSSQVTNKTPIVTSATVKSWHWAAGPVIKLSAGPHTIRIQYKEDGAKMDEWILTTTPKTKWHPTEIEKETPEYMAQQR